jgi:hypothetical protein
MVVGAIKFPDKLKPIYVKTPLIYHDGGGTGELGLNLQASAVFNVYRDVFLPGGNAANVPALFCIPKHALPPFQITHVCFFRT